MPFAFDHRPRGKPRTYRPYEDRDTMAAALTDVCVNSVAVAAMADRVLPHVFVSAACLWFESLDREDQVGRAQENAPRGQYRNYRVHGAIGRKVRAWRFPIFSRAVVFGAAIIGFTRLDNAERKAWIRDLSMFLDDATKPAPASLKITGQFQERGGVAC